MRREVRKLIANEIKRQSNEYGSLMMQEIKTNRKLGMFYHDCVTNLYEMASKVFGLKAKDFGINNNGR